MKFGSFEGTPEELKNVCENHGFDPTAFLDTPARFRPRIWGVITCIVAFTFISVCLWTFVMPRALYNSLTLINIIIVIITTALVHLRFEKWPITALSFIGGLIVLSVSLGYMTPKDAINEMKDKALQNDK